jgi:hypothetical protein
MVQLPIAARLVIDIPAVFAQDLQDLPDGHPQAPET